MRLFVIILILLAICGGLMSVEGILKESVGYQKEMIKLIEDEKD